MGCINAVRTPPRRKVESLLRPDADDPVIFPLNASRVFDLDSNLSCRNRKRSPQRNRLAKHSADNADGFGRSVLSRLGGGSLVRRFDRLENHPTHGHRAQVVTDGDFEHRQFDHRDDRRDARSGLLASDVDPVAAPECNGPDGVLGQVVTQLHNRIVQKADQPLPKR
jgi:hypothetical protein